MKTTPTPGFSRRMTFAFTTDKRGRGVAYYWSHSYNFGSSRWIRTKLDEARVFVAMDLADEVPYPTKAAA